MKLKTLLLLLLFTFSCYADPPDHANNPDGDDMPDQANCIFCDDDEAPIPDGIYWFAAGVLFMKLYKSKNKQDDKSRAN